MAVGTASGDPAVSPGSPTGILASNRTPRLPGVQLLRFVAALGVMILHGEIIAYSLGRFVGVELPRLEWITTAGFGRDTLFVASGFVMIISSRRLVGAADGRRTFLLRRLARIAPLYWLATLVMLAWFLKYGPLPDAATIATSFAFLPYASNTANGRIVPMLEMGWTLQYEMEFYLIFALCMGSTLEVLARRVALVLALLVATGLVLSLMPTVSVPLPVHSWTRPILLEFVAGIAVGMLYIHGRRISGRAALGLVAVAVVLMLANREGTGADLTSLARTLTWGLGGTALLSAVVLGPWVPRHGAAWVFAGDITFVVYLFHLPVQLLAQMAWRHFDLPYDQGMEWLFVGLTTASAMALGVAIHLWLETPLTDHLNALIERHRRRT